MTTKSINLDLHPAQLEIYKDPSRFKVVAAGRRWGKTVLAKVMAITDGMQTERDGIDLKGSEVWYVAPTYGQAKGIFWRPLKDAAGPLIKKVWETDLILELLNSQIIALKGADNPDTLRGRGLGTILLDEYASMRADVWEYALRPALADCAPASRAIFIGTPDPENGRNHFFDLHEYADSDTSPDWRAWTYRTIDNPFIDPREVETAKRSMSDRAFRREFEASFDDDEGQDLNPRLLETVSKPNHQGSVYITVDLAGFGSSTTESRATLRHRDETAIAIVRAQESGWHVLDIIHGQWSVRETSTRILAAVRKYRPNAVGIEKGALKTALDPYLHDEQQRLGVRFPIDELTHGGQNKVNRIRWALSGRLEQGRLTCEPGTYVHFLKKQMRSFPNASARDDMLDALAYIDQIAVTQYYPETWEDDWDPIDEAAGF